MTHAHDRHHHEPEALLAWRYRQPPSAIMRPSTFREIERRARARGYRNPKAVAAAAYWRSAAVRYRRAKRRAHHGRTR